MRVQRLNVHESMMRGVWAMIRRLLYYMRPYRKIAIGAILCIAVESIFELIIPLMMAQIIDVGVANGDTHYIFTQGAWMIACGLIAMVLGILSARLTAACGHGFGAELRKAEYQKVQSFSFGNADKYKTSSLVTRLTGDVVTIQNSITVGMRPAVRGPFMMVTAVVSSFFINAELALIFLVAIPVLAVILLLIVRRVGPLYSVMQRAVDLVNRTVQENLTAIRVVKSYVREEHETEKFEASNQALSRAAERSYRLAVLNAPAFQLVMYCTIICLLWFGGNMISLGTLQAGALTGFLSYVLQVLNSLMMISNVFLMLTRALASGERIVEVLDEIPELDDGRATDARVERGEVVFDHVWFKYHDGAEEYSLTDIDLRFPAGSTIGILGQTGSAKSTLVQLIPRLYDVSKGRVLIDGRTVWEYTLKHLHDAVGMVLQKNTLFSGTVRENLLWGNEHATDEEIEEACRISCADEFLGRLEHGLEAELGQGGVNVSGGQKQRLCIARALLKKPKVLILDDSTSAVDTATEAKIRQGLKTALPDTTKIIIAQRVTSVADADLIVMMQDGKVRATGTHESLLKNDPVYQDLYESQKKGAEL